MAQQEYLRSKFYLVSIDEKLVLPHSFKTCIESFNYAQGHNLTRRRYTGIKGSDVIRMLSKELIKEAQESLPQVVRSTIPEPLAIMIRRELRKIPTWKLREAYDKLKRGEPTGVDLVEKHRLDAINAVREILWERGKLPRDELKDTSVVLEDHGEFLPMTIKGVKAPWEMTREEFFKPVELPKDWKEQGYNPIIEKRGAGRTRIVKIITPDGEELFPLDDYYIKFARAKYGRVHEEVVKKALEKGLFVPPQVLADYPHLKAKYSQIPKDFTAVPVTLHPYAPTARQFEDEMEKLYRTDPDEFYRRKKLVNQAIKEREGGKIKALPQFSLTDLRRIKAHADSLYG